MDYPEIVHEDADLLIINKPPGWVAHSGAGEEKETIVDWLLKNHPQIITHTWDDPSRAGIVHRLDKDTSGIMILAKSPEMLSLLQTEFKERRVQKQYVAFLYGCPKDREGDIETFMGRHPKRRQEQTVLPIQQATATRRLAITHYAIKQNYIYKNNPISETLFYPQTGRMHQLRVHAKYLGTPILGDLVYTIKPAKRLSKELGVKRQMLHAESITLCHPSQHDQVTFTAPMPQDMKDLKSLLLSLG